MKKKILYIYTNYSTFVRTDFEILSSEHDITKYQYKPLKGLVKNAIQFIKQFFYLLFNIWKYDAVFIWFADYHSFLPVLYAKLTGKKSFVVVGGYDVARIPSLNYGGLLSKRRSFFIVFSMNNCTLNLTVSKYVDRKVKWIAKNSKTKLVYNCVNFKSDIEDEIDREDLIITVGLINSERAFLLKGIDTFIEVSKLLPEYNFLVIGTDIDKIPQLVSNAPENVNFIDIVKHEELEKYYRRAKIYCQFSRSEAFGVAVAEAIFFGCIPIVTMVGGLPELVKGFGHITLRDCENISQIVKKNILDFKLFINTDSDNFVRFTKNNRKKKLISLICYNFRK